MTAPDALREVLLACGFDPEMADLHVANDNVRLFRGEPVVAYEASDPILGSNDLFVLYASVGQMHDSDAWWDLCMELVRWAPHTDRIVVRAPGGVGIHEPFELLCDYVWKQPITVRSPVMSPADVRPARAQDVPFLVRLLRQALMDGYADFAGRLDFNALEAVAVEMGQAVADGRLRSAVAVVGGKQAGHCTWDLTCVDEMTGIGSCEVVDVFVPEEALKGACQEALVAAAEADALAHNIERMLGHVVAERSGRHRRVIDALTGAGWTVQHSLWAAETGELIDAASLAPCLP